MNQGLPFSFFIKVVGVMGIVVGLLVLKVYISNQIYYKSRTINKLESEVAALKEENSILSMNIEKLRYKTEILDSIEIENKENNSSQAPLNQIEPAQNLTNTKTQDKNKTLNQSDIKKLFNKTKDLNGSRVDGAGEVND